MLVVSAELHQTRPRDSTLPEVENVDEVTQSEGLLYVPHLLATLLQARVVASCVSSQTPRTMRSWLSPLEQFAAFYL